MYEQYVGKTVEVLVAHAANYGGRSVSPAYYTGRLVKITEKTIVLFAPVKKGLFKGRQPKISYKSEVVINLDYVISMTEASI